MKTLKALIAAGLLAAGIGTAQANEQGDALLGSGLGGAGGAWLGSQFGSQGGAIIGGGLGALTGTFLATNRDYDDDRRDRGRYEPRRGHACGHYKQHYWRR